MRRRLAVFGSLLMILALVFTGCAAPAAPAAPAAGDAPAAADAPAAEGQAAAGDKIELRVAWWGSQDRHDRTIKAIEMFEQLHPEIDVVYEFSGWDDHWTKMATQAAGNNLPDVMQQDYARIEEWVGRDLLLPLDDYVADGSIDFTNVADGAIAGGRLDDVLYAVNLGTNSQSVLLDLDAFEAAGIEVPDEQWTWADFEATVMALHEKLGIWGLGPALSNEQMWKSLYLGHGQWSYNDEGTGLGYEDDQIFADYLHMLLRLQEAGAIPTREEEVARWTGTGVEALPIVTKEAAMDLIHSNQIVAVWNAAGEDRNLRMIHLPRPDGGQPENYLKPSQFFSITSQAKYPKEAAMFIDYFTNNVEANKALMAERGVPISSVVRDELQPLLTAPQLEMFDYISRIEADNSPIRPADPAGHADLISNVYFPSVVDPVLYGQLAPEDAVKILRDEATVLLAKNAE